VAIFAGTPGYQKAAIGTSAGTVYNIGASGLVSPQNVTVVNSGPATLFIGGTSAPAVTGFPVAAGGQVTLSGAAVNLWGITSSGTAYVEAGLATVLAVD